MHRRVLSIAGAAVVVAGGSSAVVAAQAAPPAPAQAAAKKTIVQIAAGDPQFSTLVKLVKKAGLAKTLSGGSYTVFAPTNAAFKKVPKSTLDALAKDKAKLKAVLLYHAVKGRVPASKVVKLKSAKTVEGSRVKIKVKGGKVYLNGSTRVIKTDIRASNGIVHVINGVLLPPSR
jgi:uncharacterized surface protein with fasciclin (FAS1) repeats